MRRLEGEREETTAEGLWRVCEVATPLGRYCVVVDASSTVHMAYWESERLRAERHWRRWYRGRVWPEREPLPAIAASVTAYFAGNLEALHLLRVAPRGTAFEQRVWSVVRGIPAGERASYAWIAQALGQPRAARAVGRAVGHNPILLAIPCHRVVQKDGRIGGYAGGAARKRWLLGHEHTVAHHPRG